jgi:D-serine deaminase-like pyridoxal phosphate-dependent protein
MISLATSSSLDEANPDLLGRPIEDLDTPVALVDLDVFEQNAATIRRFLTEHGRTWRPHTKAHKSPFLARVQLEHGAIGVTCAKVAEAEVMVAHGIGDVLIANEPATAQKWQRVAALQRSARVIACVDDEIHVRWAAEAAAVAGVTVPVFIEVDVGMFRAGTTSPAAAVELADLIATTPGVHLAGLMGYEGHLPRAWPEPEKVAQCTASMQILLAAVAAVRAAGHPVDIVSYGGTGTFAATADLGGLTECQAGGGCLMDRFYLEECHVDLPVALTLLASTISTRQPGRAVFDAGFKALGRLEGFPLPRPVGIPGAEVIGLSAEHGMLAASESVPAVGSPVQLVPGYSDAMLVLHDYLIGHRNGVVTDVIPLLGRGRLT